MSASVIYVSDSINQIVDIPTTFKKPREDQFQGTPLEKLTEVACRICYDSMGLKRSRNSLDLHHHIQDAPNLSVYEHANVVIELPSHLPEMLYKVLLNRKGVYTELWSHGRVRIAANARAILEWKKYNKQSLPITELEDYKRVSMGLENTLLDALKAKMPNALARKAFYDDFRYHYDLPTKLSPEQRFISVWIYGSRGLTHEQVRHRFAISQRSTRFVDELPPNTDDIKQFNEYYGCSGEYVWHPDLLGYLADPDVPDSLRTILKEVLVSARQRDRLAYDVVIQHLQPYYIKKGREELDARKQARGAARGSLGNALASEMIFTASEADWENMLHQRGSLLADAEIRETYVDLWNTLKDNVSFVFNVKTDDQGRRYLQAA